MGKAKRQASLCQNFKKTITTTASRNSESSMAVPRTVGGTMSAFTSVCVAITMLARLLLKRSGVYASYPLWTSLTTCARPANELE